MLTRASAIAVVDRERDYQDRTYSVDVMLSSGLTRAERDQDVTPHILMLESYIRKAADAWTFTKDGDNGPALKEIVKIAAIAVRALERSGNTDLFSIADR